MRVLSCCGERLLKIPEDYDIVRRLEGRLVVLVGIHQKGPQGLTQCVMDAQTRQRFDVEWQLFWSGVSSKRIPDASEMETIAVATLLADQPDTPVVEFGLLKHE